MTLVASASIFPPFVAMQDDQMSRKHSVRSNSSGHSFNLGYIHEELDEIEENKVYVAVPKEMQDWMENLKWLLNSNDKNLPIVFLHVHQHARRIATPIGYMLASGLEQQELNAHRQLEKEEMNKCLKRYLDICAKKNFKATTLSTDNDDIARGLLELVKQHKVTNLVMGAGSARTFSILPNSRTREIKPKSKIALTIREKADPSCRIRFISKGELVCIREPHQNAPDASILSRSSSGSSSDHSWPSRSHSMPPFQPNQIIGPSGLDHKSGSPHPSFYNSLTATSLKNSLPSFHDVTEDIYTRLEEAMAEAEKLRKEVYEESNRRNKAERDLVQANKQVKMLNAEKQKTSEIEEKFARQSIELEKRRKMYEQAQNELMKTNELLSSFDSQNAQLRQTIITLQSTSGEARALRGAHDLRWHGSSSVLVNCTEFTCSEIKEATNNFDPLHKIGEGGFGVVYRGFLRHTRVAIKILSRDSIQGDPQFFQEIEILSQIRHPHLVMLMGACIEARALVYEYLELGSLDKHLTNKDGNRSLPWQVRVRVACEICSALIFLHSSHVVHGDLKPENVLLDSNFITKIGDFGICRQVHVTNITTTPHYITDQPKGTFPYMDPEYLGSGELTPQYDVFSFGIVLLQLVTGRQPMKLKNDVENAFDNRQIEKMVDQSAGWPLEQARRMIQIGLWCSDASRKKRPDLGKDVWVLLESIANVASASMRRSLTRPTS